MESLLININTYFEDKIMSKILKHYIVTNALCSALTDPHNV
jgi:hypothetical protein